MCGPHQGGHHSLGQSHSRGRHQAGVTVSAGGAEPAFARNIEDDPVGILELSFEILLLRVMAEIEEEPAAGFLDSLLCGGEIVDLEAEMMRTNEVFRIA